MIDRAEPKLTGPKTTTNLGPLQQTFTRPTILYQKPHLNGPLLSLPK